MVRMPFSVVRGVVRQPDRNIYAGMEQRGILRIACTVRSLGGRITAGVRALVRGAEALPAAVSALPTGRLAIAADGPTVLDAPSCCPGDGGADPAAPTRDRPLVLVAEDNAGNYRLIEVILRNAYRLQHALNGREAVEFFDRERPGIVLMDINMPQMDGYEALRLIRERDKQVPVIALTAYAFDSDLRKMLECGFNACMTKPIDVNGIKALIESHLRK